jgi:hypothetical protein
VEARDLVGVVARDLEAAEARDLVGAEVGDLVPAARAARAARAPAEAARAQPEREGAVAAEERQRAAAERERAVAERERTAEKGTVERETSVKEVRMGLPATHGAEALARKLPAKAAALVAAALGGVGIRLLARSLESPTMRNVVASTRRKKMNSEEDFGARAANENSSE